MPQGYTPGPSRATMQAGMGYVPAGRPQSAGGVAVSGPISSPQLSTPASGATPGTFGDATHVPQITIDASGAVTGAGNVAITFPVSFGSGAPGGTPADGVFYFDTSGSPYVGYIGHSSSWHVF